MFLIAEEAGGVRAEGSPGGNGPPPGIYVPAPHRWLRTTTHRNYGSCIRRKHGKILQINK